MALGLDRLAQVLRLAPLGVEGCEDDDCSRSHILKVTERERSAKRQKVGLPGSRG